MNLLKLTHISLIIIGLNLLVGCSSLFGPNFDIVPSENLTPGPILSDEQARHHWQQQQLALNKLSHWQIMGKIGLFNQDQAVSLNLYWQQMGDDYEITMSNLFGTPLIEMKKQGQTLWLRIEQEAEYWGSNPEVLINQLTDWQLPVNQMPKWLIGLPGEASYQLSNQGVIKSAHFEDDHHWQIAYGQYQFWQEYLLPRKILITSDTNKLKVLVSEWKFKKQNKKDIQH